MNKVLSTIAVFAILLAVAGCTGTTNSTAQSKPFIGGTEGINVAFTADSPPAQVDDGGNFPFDIVVQLMNKGEHTVQKSDVTVSLVGIKPEEFSKGASDLTKNPDEDVIATKKDPEGAITEGPPVFVTFSGFNHKDMLVGNKDYPIRAEACYLYETQAMAQICVRKNNIDPEKNGVCTVSADKDVFNSGAPVQVSAFKEFGRAKNKIGFQFTVEHVGKGDLFEKNSNCNTERKYEDVVFVKVSTQFNSGLKCSGLGDGTSGHADDTSGFVKLFGESRIVSCTQEVDSTSDFESPAVITLDYDYRDTVQTTIIVKHIPEEEK